jgi:tetratricopeptide (TPR) repeat protein
MLPIRRSSTRITSNRRAMPVETFSAQSLRRSVFRARSRAIPYLTRPRRFEPRRAGERAAAAAAASAPAAVVGPARHGFLAGEAAVALAETGLADDARAKIAENLERWPDDIRTRILTGDALATLGDTEVALAHFQAALPLAQQAEDPRRSVTCQREYSGSPVPPPVRPCSAAGPSPGRPGPSARAHGNRRPG